MKSPGGNVQQSLLPLIRSLLGPGSAELGEMVADRVRLWRWKTLHSILLKAQRFRDENDGICSTEAIPLKSFLPFVEEASKEDDEELEDWWARLLVGPSAGETGFKLLCVEVLKNIGKSEAKFLALMLSYESPEWEDVAVEVDKMEDNARAMADALFATYLEKECRIFVLKIYYKGYPSWIRRDVPAGFWRSFIVCRKIGLVEAADHHLFENRNAFEYIKLTSFGREFLRRVKC